jgi:hypothetical protein
LRADISTDCFIFFVVIVPDGSFAICDSFDDLNGFFFFLRVDFWDDGKIIINFLGEEKSGSRE